MSANSKAQVASTKPRATTAMVGDFQKPLRLLSILIMTGTLLLGGHSSFAAEAKPVRVGVITVIEEMSGDIAPAALRNASVKTAPVPAALNTKVNASFASHLGSAASQALAGNTVPATILKLPPSAQASH